MTPYVPLPRPSSGGTHRWRSLPLTDLTTPPAVDSPPVASGLEVQSEDAGGSWHQFEGPPHSGFALTSSDGGREPAGTVSAASMDGAGASSDAQGAKVQVR